MPGSISPLRQKTNQSLGQPLEKLELWMCDTALPSLREAESCARGRDYGKSVSDLPASLSVTGLALTQDAGTSQLVYGFQTKRMRLFIGVESLCLLGKGGFWASHSAILLTPPSQAHFLFVSSSLWLFTGKRHEGKMLLIHPVLCRP